MHKIKITWLLAVLSLSLSHCAVREYPRELTTQEKILTNVAHSLDTAGAVLHNNINTGPGYDINRQMVQLDNYMFYADPKFYQDPDNFYIKPQGLPEVTTQVIGEEKDYTVLLLIWPSQYEPRNPEFVPLYETYTETHTAYAVMYKSKKANKGAILVLHGWTGGDARKTVKMEGFERLLDLGYDAALLQHPYHGLRMPAGSVFSGEYFMSGEVSRINEAMCQAVTDARSLSNYLSEQYEVVGLRGGSLGGITVLNTAMVEDDLAFAIAVVPPSSLGDIPENTKLAPYVVEGMRRSGLDVETVRKVLYVSSPANYTPDIPVEDVLIIAGMGDNFVPPAQPQKVWEAWGHPQIQWYPGGHVFHFKSKPAYDAEEKFLLDHLTKSKAPN